MLQILIKPNDRYSVSEMAQMAIEAGAAWIVLSVGEGDGLRDEVRDITEMCRTAGIILTCDNVELAREYAMHGVLVDGTAMSPAALREELGAEAIIGAVAGSADAVLSLSRADIDYVALTEADSRSEALIADVRQAGCNIPVVALLPDMPLSDAYAKSVLEAGFTGICAGARFFDGENPVAEIESLLNTL